MRWLWTLRRASRRFWGSGSLSGAAGSSLLAVETQGQPVVMNGFTPKHENGASRALLGWVGQESNPTRAERSGKSRSAHLPLQLHAHDLLVGADHFIAGLHEEIEGEL